MPTRIEPAAPKLPWWLTSKTILGGIIAIGAGFVGWDMEGDDKAVVIEAVMAVIGGIVAIYGRYKAQAKIEEK